MHTGVPGFECGKFLGIVQQVGWWGVYLFDGGWRSRDESVSEERRKGVGEEKDDLSLVNQEGSGLPSGTVPEGWSVHPPGLGSSLIIFPKPRGSADVYRHDGRVGACPSSPLRLVVACSSREAQAVTVGCPLKMAREPLGKGTRGRTMELVLQQPEVESTDVLAPIPLRSIPEVDSGLKRKRATGDDGAGPSKRVRHVSLGLSTSTEEETPDASPTLATKEVIETPPPNVEATSDSSAPVTHAVQSPPQTSPKVFEGMPVDQLMEELDMVTAQQAALVVQLRARFSNERSQSVQKDEEIMLLKTQCAMPADARSFEVLWSQTAKYVRRGGEDHLLLTQQFPAGVRRALLSRPLLEYLRGQCAKHVHEHTDERYCAVVWDGKRERTGENVGGNGVGEEEQYVGGCVAGVGGGGRPR
ncbi:hypothetical protein Tco_0228524 [Tanacetum coccineum]